MVRQLLAEQGAHVVLSEVVVRTHVLQCAACAEVAALLVQADGAPRAEPEAPRAETEPPALGSDGAPPGSRTARANRAVEARDAPAVPADGPASSGPTLGEVADRNARGSGPTPAEVADCNARGSGPTPADGEPIFRSRDAESTQFVRKLRPRSRVGLLLAAAAALALGAAGTWATFATRPAERRVAARSSSATEEEAPDWLAESAAQGGYDEGGRGRRHRDEAADLDRRKSHDHDEAADHARRKSRHRFGLEGPAHDADPHLSRESARAEAESAGILGLLPRARSAPATAGPAAPAPEGPSHDPMSALGALMGDQIGANFGFGGLGLRGTGRGGGGSGYGVGSGSGYGAGEPELHAASHGAHDRDAAYDHSSAEPMSAALPRSVFERPRASHRARGAHTASRNERGTRPAPASPPQPSAADSGHRLRSHLRSALSHPATPAAGPDTRAPEARPPAGAAEALLARFSTLDGVRFIEPHGYFANTYVPGDPELRTLHARLQSVDRADVLPPSLRAARLEAGARRIVQPFDAPGQAALSLYVSASEPGITSRRRMLVQVGLQATPRYSGRRPPMNVGLVLDAREPLDPAAYAAVRALLAAFAEARGASDTLALFAAGPGGGELVGADEFRFGPLSIALQRLQTERAAAAVSLPDALQSAVQRLGRREDPNAPLGSSVAIVIAPRTLDSELARLQAIAHASAVEGVAVSVFGVGPDVAPEPLERLALAGQGNRRVLTSTADAAQVVDRELSAVARVVARAVRLRIRLAAGVRLVGVLGSHPLDDAHASRVREAETSIDRRLRQNLGIQSDRGEDEEGVQIVIPSFYAADAHVVLLDVVAEGPGPIADVSVRFKDLVHLDNGSARESLWLPNVERARGPLQRNVLKNLVADELAGELRRAADALASADPSASRRSLEHAVALLDSLPVAIPELRGDRELDRDRALVMEYAQLLGGLAAPAQRQFAADSLRLASLLKLQPRPQWDARLD